MQKTTKKKRKVGIGVRPERGKTVSLIQRKKKSRKEEAHRRKTQRKTQHTTRGT